MFSAMLDRQQKAERIKSVVAMLKRYETVFRLPTRIRQATERGEFEQVIAEHRKAKALMETLAASSSEVWRNLFAEVEKVLALRLVATRCVLTNANSLQQCGHSTVLRMRVRPYRYLGPRISNVSGVKRDMSGCVILLYLLEVQACCGLLMCALRPLDTLSHPCDMHWSHH